MPASTPSAGHRGLRQTAIAPVASRDESFLIHRNSVSDTDECGAASNFLCDLGIWI